MLPMGRPSAGGDGGGNAAWSRICCRAEASSPYLKGGSGKGKWHNFCPPAFVLGPSAGAPQARHAVAQGRRRSKERAQAMGKPPTHLQFEVSGEVLAGISFFINHEF